MVVGTVKPPSLFVASVSVLNADFLALCKVFNTDASSLPRMNDLYAVWYSLVSKGFVTSTAAGAVFIAGALWIVPPATGSPASSLIAALTASLMFSMVVCVSSVSTAVLISS